MPRAIIFGEIAEFEEGKWIAGRKEMMPSCLHRNWAAGIDGNGKEGTAAIVLSGGYEDDEDSGEEIIYTGAGGNDPNTGKQVENQSWGNRGNAGLLVSMNKGLPVRVIRGHKHRSEFSPKTGYLYSGLYSVVDAWEETGRSGFKICRYRLVYSGSNQHKRSPEEVELNYDKKEARRTSGTVLRIIRDTNISQDIKDLYEYRCQICDTAIETKNGLYAEGAHIKPLGKPHNGDDCSDNILCLCPNHHVMFDKGGIAISDNLTVLGSINYKFYAHPKHVINIENLRYHRKVHGYG